MSIIALTFRHSDAYTSEINASIHDTNAETLPNNARPLEAAGCASLLIWSMRQCISNKLAEEFVKVSKMLTWEWLFTALTVSCWISGFHQLRLKIPCSDCHQYHLKYTSAHYCVECNTAIDDFKVSIRHRVKNVEDDKQSRNELSTVEFTTYKYSTSEFLTSECVTFFRQSQGFLRRFPFVSAVLEGQQVLPFVATFEGASFLTSVLIELAFGEDLSYFPSSSALGPFPVGPLNPQSIDASSCTPLQTMTQSWIPLVCHSRLCSMCIIL